MVTSANHKGVDAGEHGLIKFITRFELRGGSTVKTGMSVNLMQGHNPKKIKM